MSCRRPSSPSSQRSRTRGGPLLGSQAFPTRPPSSQHSSGTIPRLLRGAQGLHGRHRCSVFWSLVSAPCSLLLLLLLDAVAWMVTPSNRIVPVKETHSVEIGWPLPPQHSQYLAKPASYLSHLFGHEGSGSILSLLKVCEGVSCC